MGGHFRQAMGVWRGRCGEGRGLCIVVNYSFLISVRGKCEARKPRRQNRVNQFNAVNFQSMKKTILAILFFLSYNSVHSQNGGNNIDELFLVTIKEVALRKFLDTYSEQIGNDEQVYSLQIRQRDEHIHEYRISTVGYWSEGSTAPLAYAKYDDHMVLIYSGLESFFPSQKRNKLLLQILEDKVKVYDENYLATPNVDYPAGKLTLCDGVKVLHQEIGHFPGDDPCVVEGPPLDEEY